MRASSLSNPFFILHGMNRDIAGTTPMKYFAAITVEIPKYPGVLYDDILAQYRNLVPINIKVEYIYILNDWFKQSKYHDTLDYINLQNCHYYFNEIPLDFLNL